jgi:alkanesulfonate monooxygenase SsuD/methylene tetrahydromethanopterin reductase-like flavin-dependent oxidoreductase (luciferase family)
MEFGIFDHLDRNHLPLRDFYEARLNLIEAYDAAGFYAYHVAEHHFTPLGMAPSPSVFLSAVAQRTRRLRFGPLVYALPLHHPLRLLEEICMLDHLSGGRLEIGFGRGSSPVEIGFYGQNPETAQEVYAEALELILQGLSRKRLDFTGRYFSLDHVPLEIEPLQKPHPPIWYGVHSVESAQQAARNRFHIVSLDSAAESRAFFEAYRKVWLASQQSTGTMPKLGISRFIVVAENDGAAVSAARRAYAVWHRSFYHLFQLRGIVPAHPRPPDFDALMQIGQGAAGNPQTIADFVRSQISESGATYFLGQFAFGDLTVEESSRSVELFSEALASMLNPALAAGSKSTR